MTFSKRILDLALLIMLATLLFVPTAIVVLWLLWAQGRPILYLGERMKTPSQPFLLWKFRTMTVAGTDAGVSGGDKSARITRAGRILRRYRLDEIPQLWNILRGDMSFVGPRPPLRQYVERFPAIYARVLRSRPGLTGLATLHYRRTEERLLSACATREETDAVYARRCVPRKARLDLIWQARRSTCGDFLLILATIRQVLGRK